MHLYHKTYIELFLSSAVFLLDIFIPCFRNLFVGFVKKDLVLYLDRQYVSLKSLDNKEFCICVSWIKFDCIV